jgi:hypothetical protein
LQQHGDRAQQQDCGSGGNPRTQIGDKCRRSINQAATVMVTVAAGPEHVHRSSPSLSSSWNHERRVVEQPTLLPRIPVPPVPTADQWHHRHQSEPRCHHRRYPA